MKTHSHSWFTPLGRLALGPALIMLLTLALPAPAPAAGLLVADGGFGGVLEIKDHQVQVTVNNGIAVTKVTQVFHNTESRQLEALYTFPVPKAASVANFSMWIQGKEMVGEVIEKERAREIYDSYKRVRRDPGLLEQVDYRTFEMRIFPIGPGADQKVEITYYQELDFDRDQATYVYPLATATRAGIDARATGTFSLDFELKSAVPITELESPSHGQSFAVARHAPAYWQANLEIPGGSLAHDVVIACKIEREKTGLDLLTSRQNGEDGFFCLTVTAGQDAALDSAGMDYVFVLDASGSMADGGKLLLSKDAVAAFLNQLSDADRLEVMTFNITPNLGFDALLPATEENKRRALDHLSNQQARGGTILQPAVATAYKFASGDRPLNVVVLSDGLTEQRERQELLRQIQNRPGNTRVFCVGVGNDVNRPLLEQLAEDSGGLAAFLSFGDNLERQARSFHRKLARPFATQLEITINGVEVVEREPEVLPNLYFGAPVRIYGRYRGSGDAEIRLRGSVQGVEFKETAMLAFPKTDAANPEIHRMWAWHRVNRLLKSADRLGDRSPVIPEIVRLGEDFSIATEYTSFLVLENDAEYQRWKIARKNRDSTERDRLAQAQRREQLDGIRAKAFAHLGPEAAKPAPDQNALSAPTARPQVDPQVSSPATRAQKSKSPESNQKWDFDMPGSSPVGPLGVLGAAWLLRRKRRSDPSRAASQRDRNANQS